MNNRRQLRETEKVVRRVMKTVVKYDQIGKSEFEEILYKILQQVEKNTRTDPDKIVEVTSSIIEDIPNEYDQLTEEERSMEAMITYLYGN